MNSDFIGCLRELITFITAIPFLMYRASENHDLAEKYTFMDFHRLKGR